MQKRKNLAGKKKGVGTIKIIILHGWTYSLEKWKPFIKLLKEGRTIKLVKIPSLTDKLEAIWNLDNYVNWLNQKIGNEKVVLIGHSNGGRISLAYAAKYPEKLSHLILIDSAGIYHNELPLRLKRLIFKTIAQIGKKITSSETLRNLLYKLVREGDYKNATPTQRQIMLNLINIDLTKTLTKIKVSTLIIWGGKDKITPLADGELMHKLIDNSNFFVIKDAKHSPQFTHPKEVLKIINEHI